MAKYKSKDNPDNVVDADLDPKQHKTNPVMMWKDKDGTTQRCAKGAFDELYEPVKK